MLDFLLQFAREFWVLLEEMSVWLIFGFLVAGALSVFISAERVERHLGGRGAGPVWKATLFGIPLPLCSCGVIPVAASLRQHGAGRGATSSFLLSTPQTGVDSILVTGGLLGPVFAVFRPLAALVTGIVGGTIISALDRDEDEGGSDAASDCDDGCGEMPREGGKLRRALSYGLISLPRDIAGALIVGLLAAALIATLVPADFFTASLGSGLLAMLVVMAVSIPIYVCATGSVPLALALIHLGISPGTALVFLIAGPATNSATITTVWKVLGRRSALVYLAVVALGALASGLILDALYAQDWIQADWVPSMTHHHALLPAWVNTAAAYLLIVLLVWGRWGPRSQSRELTMSDDRGTLLSIQGMSCEHCVNTVRRSLSEAPGVSSVDVDLAAGRARVEGEGLDLSLMIAALGELGYQAEEL